MTLRLPQRPPAPRDRSGATLIEVMVTMGIFSMVVLGLVQFHLLGLKQDQLVQSKLGASDQSRASLSRMTGEIRSAKLLRVGHKGSDNGFAPIGYGTNQQGTALQMSFTTDTNSFIRYYYDANANELRRKQSGVNGHTVVASHLTNTMFFRAEDHLGNVVVDGTHSYTIRVLLEFYQYQYPLTQVGPGNYYDYYKLEFKATRRAHD